jgi:hypothetical protein
MLPAAVLVIILMHGSRLQAEGILRRFTIEGLWPPASCQRLDDGDRRAADRPD